MTTLVTGAAGFIGYHAAKAQLQAGEDVVGLDNLNAYYDPALKQARLDELARFPGFRFEKMDLADDSAVLGLVRDLRPGRILHLGAQAGVRYSLEAPFAYARSNLLGHLSILEAARHLGDALDHLVYASSSSVMASARRCHSVKATPPHLQTRSTQRPSALMS